ncbi:tetratricopeptide repeat protein [Flavobacterium amniphilum]|uniref:tetratricopeptide repeat protein n=1 Tax=Flavobacterium amniphilum TaxID=1834035 RepID=UPI002029BAEF|nr:tetratricopeptide repeat protein [Flavobacterium amniphilum]MCL9803959.1 tetratricopeptide repeat protein [Flavobacterium amniphilum]
MRNTVQIVALLLSGIAFGQTYTVTPPPGGNPQAHIQQQGGGNEYLAQNYFDRGEFDKAVLIYEDLLRSQPNNHQHFQKLIACYQQLKDFVKAENTIKTKLDRTKAAQLYVELGYNYQLQNQLDKAQKNYKLALDKIEENSNNVYGVAREFEIKVLIPQAIEAYTLGQKLNPNNNFDYQIALLHGQLGKFDLMIDSLIDYGYKYPNNLLLVQNQLNRFLAEDHSKVFADYLRKALLIRTQKNQDLFWNQFMSWFFVQQKEYGKAFIQEKAIFKRNPDNFSNILTLARLASDENETETEREILEFVLANTQDSDILINVNCAVLKLDIEKATPATYPVIQTKISQLLQQFGTSNRTIQLQVQKAHFDAFYLKQFEPAKETLTKALELPLDLYQKAQIKLELADVLLLNEKFNQSIIYYAQVEEDLSNDEIAHQASLKMAKASYYKGDFDWAQQQFKVLKSSASQLIANDALQLFLLISDNTVEDSTQVALKKFARADFLSYQNKNTEALEQFKTILQQHKDQSIEDETLLQIGKIYEKQKDYQQALTYYQQIIDRFPEDIYIDEALFFAAEIYRKYLNDNEKAKSLYEKILFNHQDSIYFVDARNNFRKLRGDTNL